MAAQTFSDLLKMLVRLFNLRHGDFTGKNGFRLVQ